MSRSKLLSSVALFVFLATIVSAAPPAPVVFDWFEYTGNDSVFDAALPENGYRNPILAGFYPDPSVCRVGEDFYLINSSFAYFPGVPIFHSRDLVHWKQIGHILDRPSQLKLDGHGVSRGIFAPALHYHAGTFYMITTLVDTGGNFFVTAKNPAGPWSDPTFLPEVDGIDTSFFFDQDGKAYVVNNGPPEGKPLYSGHRAIWIQEFDLNAQKLVGPRKIVVNGGVDIAKKPVWIEGPHLYRRGDWYYLMCAEGGTDTDHSEVIFRSRSPWGPFEPGPVNPILTQRDLPATRAHPITSTGHADLVEAKDGSWWVVFLGCRPYSDNRYATGRETFMLPVTWNGDWPSILEKGKEVPYVIAGPKGQTTAEPSSKLTGNFTWRDNFDSAALDSSWVFLRTPHETWWDFRSNPGHLTLTARHELLSGKGNPTFLAHRLQHTQFSVSTSFAPPVSAAISAGIVAFQNETHHFYFGVRQDGDHLVLFLESLNGSPTPQILARHEIPNTATIAVRISGDGPHCRFEYTVDPSSWKTLAADVDAGLLTTKVAGGFVGAMVGIHARAETP